jgi:coproporphyrinogen III oxidase
VTSPLRARVADYLRELQDRICAGLESTDGEGSFREDRWTHHPEGGSGAGGGITRVLSDGRVIEKGGVNFSEVTGRLSPRLADRLGAAEQRYFATGVSLVIHPLSPMVPTVHANLRYLELRPEGSTDTDPPQRAWFGGGADLTPYYLFEEDAAHFHRSLRLACDRVDTDYYPRFKRGCDEYFYIKHRGESRGVGGLFFDYLEYDLAKDFRLVREVGNVFLDAYLPIVERRFSEDWSAAQKRWQQIRRGRYVEFNLVYDRGTLFGLETEGRTESILMSLPPECRWEYDYEPLPGSREAALLEVLRHPRDWA